MHQGRRVVIAQVLVDVNGGLHPGHQALQQRDLLCVPNTVVLDPDVEHFPDVRLLDELGDDLLCTTLGIAVLKQTVL